MTLKFVKYCTSVDMANLREKVKLNLNKYKECKACELISDDKCKSSKVKYEPFSARLKVDNINLLASEAKNALLTYESLKNLTPRQASYEEVWVYYCHIECLDYVNLRWPTTNDNDVKNHYFAKAPRTLIRDNGISRLWWLGWFANQITPDNPSDFLSVILYSQDIPVNLFGRPSMSTNIYVLKQIYYVMRESYEKDKKLLERDVFRKWMGLLNRKGGLVLFDSLPKNDLYKLLNTLAKEVIELSKDEIKTEE